MVLDDLFGKPKKKRKRPAKKRSALEKSLGIPVKRKRRRPQSAAKKVEKAVGNVVEDMVTAAIKKITG